MPKETKSKLPQLQLPQLQLLPLKREKNLRTYSRRPKNRKTSVSATSEVTSSEKCIALDYNTNVIAVKLENNASGDSTCITDVTIIENMKSEIVGEDYAPPLQDEIIKKAEEIIKLSCSRKYDDDTLNFVREQLYQVLKVLKSAKQTTVDKIS